MSLQGMESYYIYDPVDNRFLMVSDLYVLDLDDPEVFQKNAEWAIEAAKEQHHAREIEDRCIPTPSDFDIHEYRIMQSFSEDYPEPSKSKRLCDSLRGRGAFRRFKDLTFQLGIQEEWYRYLEAAHRRIAIEWCEEHDLEWEESAGRAP